MTVLPKVTISIPAYNQEKYIARCIESALALQYDNLEINISDDNSTDATHQIAKQYETDRRVNVYQNERNIGRLKNYRQLLYNYAAGDWVLNLDGDDHLTSQTFVQEAMQHIAGRKADNVVLYHANFFDIDKFRKTDVMKELAPGVKLVSGKNYVLNRFKVNFFYHLSALYKRSAAISCGFYSFDALHTDSLSLIKAGTVGNVIVDKKAVGLWNLNEASESHKINNPAEQQKVAQAFNELCSFLQGAGFTEDEIDRFKTQKEQADGRAVLYEAATNGDIASFRKAFADRKSLSLFEVRQFSKLLLRKVFK